MFALSVMSVTTNLRFLSAVMFDGRESSPATGTTKILHSNYPNSLLNDLTRQSLDATTGHAQGDGTRPTAAEQKWFGSDPVGCRAVL
jgi:hypothetical protein